MSLEVAYTDSYQAVLVSTVLDGLDELGSDTDPVQPYLYPYYDGIIPLIRGSATEARVFDPRQVSGFKRLGLGRKKATFEGSPPRNYPYSSFVDAQNFGSIFGMINSLQGNYRDAEHRVLASGDKNVLHSTYSGRAEYRHGLSVFEGFTTSGTAPAVWGISVPVFSTGAGITNLTYLDGHFFLGNDVAFASKGWVGDCLAAISNYAQEAGGTIHNEGITLGRRIKCDITDFHYYPSGNNGDWAMSYKIQVRLWNSGAPFTSTKWVQRISDVELNIKTFASELESYPITNGEYQAQNPMVWFEQFITNHSLTWGSIYPAPVWWDSIGQFQSSEWVPNPLMVSTIVTPVSGGNVENGPQLDTSLWSPTKVPRRGVAMSYTSIHAGNVDQDIHSLAPALFYSTGDALDDFINVIKTNWIETLTELAEGARLLPSLIPFARLIGNVRSMNFLDAGGDLLDVISGLHLYNQFGLQPNLRSVREFASNFDRVRARLDEAGLIGPRTLHGNLVYELPEGEYGFGKTTLVARSKVRINFGSSSIMTFILGSSALGLVPLLTSFWDLVPFSFVADWLFQIGDRLHAAEQQAFMLMLPHDYATHSLTVTSKFPEEMMGALGLEPTLLEFGLYDPSVSYYRRFTSAFLPLLRDSRFDFLGSNSLPSLATAGSLAWSVIR